MRKTELHFDYILIELISIYLQVLNLFARNISTFEEKWTAKFVKKYSVEI